MRETFDNGETQTTTPHQDTNSLGQAEDGLDLRIRQHVELVEMLERRRMLVAHRHAHQGGHLSGERRKIETAEKDGRCEDKTGTGDNAVRMLRKKTKVGQ